MIKFWKEKSSFYLNKKVQHKCESGWIQHQAWQDQDRLLLLRRREGGEEAGGGQPEQVDQVRGSQVGGKVGGEAAVESWRRGRHQAFKLLRF